MLVDRLRSLGLNLERMNVLYMRAIEILEREKRALVLFDYEELYILFKEKDEVLTAIKALDKERLKIQDLYAALSKKDSVSTTLLSMAQDLISEGGDSEKTGRHLLVLRNILAETVEILRQKIDSNRGFIEKSVANLRSVAEHVSSNGTGRSGQQMTKAPVYTGKGKFKQNEGNKGGLLEKRL
jgi:hypothetical protein